MSTWSRWLLPLSLGLVNACTTADSTLAHAEAFVSRVDSEAARLSRESETTAWVNATYITDDTSWLLARAQERTMATVRRLVDESRQYQSLELPYEPRRKLERLRRALSAPAPADSNARRRLADVATNLSSAYAKGRYCPRPESCLSLQQMGRVMASSRDPDRLLELWKGWRSVAAPMRRDYESFARLANLGAREIGFADAGDLWRSRYDMTPAAFEAEVERLWEQVKPLYVALHCYVRRRLQETYGEEQIPSGEPIPAHLLGNMWAQQWESIYDLVEPYGDQPSLNVDARLDAQNWDPVRMVKVSERFFTSLGLPSLPASFWSRSMFSRPRDREVECHASAWDLSGQGDVRIKMCTAITEAELYTVHHELGHVYYYLLYKDQPALFQAGAHDGFHEGIGDTLILSITPAYLQSLGLLDAVPKNPRAEVNFLLKTALERIAFLPFGKLVDQWRWQVFDGRTPPARYTADWWKLREKYQGVAAPVARSEADFDPGAKYHIPGNTPYMRYFLAQVLQFQFHRALCQAAGDSGPLHRCSIYGSQAAGEKLSAMMKMGASRPWPEALAALGAGRQMDATAILDYYAPLASFLAEANAEDTCGW